VADQARGGSFLLGRLYLAGWQLQIRDGDAQRIHARRGEVELEVPGTSIAEAAGTIFARAMRSSLAISQIDVHELERLIRRGCPPETAVRIAV
jgi:hypothetical protein